MSSLVDATKALMTYMAAVASNRREADLADAIAERIVETGLGAATVDISWSENDGATVCVFCKLPDEADIRRIVHEVADAEKYTLDAPERKDSLQTYGSIDVVYGRIKLRLHPDGKTCKRVQVGTKVVPEHEEPVYEIRCEEPAEPVVEVSEPVEVF